MPVLSLLYQTICSNSHRFLLNYLGDTLRDIKNKTVRKQKMADWQATVVVTLAAEKAKEAEEEGGCSR